MTVLLSSFFFASKVLECFHHMNWLVSKSDVSYLLWITWDYLVFHKGSLQYYWVCQPPHYVQQFVGCCWYRKESKTMCELIWLIFIAFNKWVMWILYLFAINKHALQLAPRPAHSWVTISLFMPSSSIVIYSVAFNWYNFFMRLKKIIREQSSILAIRINVTPWSELVISSSS